MEIYASEKLYNAVSNKSETVENKTHQYRSCPSVIKYKTNIISKSYDWYKV